MVLVSTELVGFPLSISKEKKTVDEFYLLVNYCEFLCHLKFLFIKKCK